MKSFGNPFIIVAGQPEAQLGGLNHPHASFLQELAGQRVRFMADETGYKAPANGAESAAERMAREDTEATEAAHRALVTLTVLTRGEVKRPDGSPATVDRSIRPVAFTPANSSLDGTTLQTISDALADTLALNQFIGYQVDTIRYQEFLLGRVSGGREGDPVVERARTNFDPDAMHNAVREIWEIANGVIQALNSALTVLGSPVEGTVEHTIDEAQRVDLGCDVIDALLLDKPYVANSADYSSGVAALGPIAIQAAFMPFQSLPATTDGNYRRTFEPGIRALQALTVAAANIAHQAGQIGRQMGALEILKKLKVPESAPTREVAPTVETKKPRILFVDDEAMLRRAVVRMMKGAEVVQAGDGEEGIGLFRVAHGTDKAFDMIVTDLMMPNMGGLELIEMARALDPHIPVAMITGGIYVEGLRARAEAVTNAQLVTKPFGPEVTTGFVATAAARLAAKQKN